MFKVSDGCKVNLWQENAAEVKINIMRTGEISARGKPTDAIIAQYLANVRVYIRKYINGVVFTD